MVLSHGVELSNVHSDNACAGEACVIHNPTDHFMSTWPATWGDWGGSPVLYRECSHGELHPDPDQLAFFDKVAPYLARHACCAENCCNMDEGKYNAAKCRSCGDTVVSRWRHNFVSCTCGNIFVDGGHDYTRHGFNDSNNYENLSR